MAKTSGLSKKHSPLQQAHYQQYRVENRALKNLIRRLKTRVRRADARSTRCIKRNVQLDKRFKKGEKDLPTRSYQKSDTGAIKCLKKLGIKGYDSHLI